MHYKSVVVSAFTALTLFSPAVTGAAIRRSEPAAAPSHPPAQGGSYYITYKTEKDGEQTAYPENGSIHVTIKGVLIRVAIDDKDDIVQCIVKDKDHNQIRKFGGKDIEQTYIDFEDEDGKQAKFIDCAIGEQKDGGHQWNDSNKPSETKWEDTPKETKWQDTPEPPKETKWQDSPEPPKETKWQDSPEPPKETKWQDHPAPSTTTPPPPPPPKETKWQDSPEPPKETKWQDSPEPPKETKWQDSPEPPKETKWQDHPAPSATTPPPPPPPPQHTQWQDNKPQEPKPEPPKQEGWGDNKPEEHKPVGQPAPAPAPAHEAPKPQEGWQDSNGHGKPQEGGHSGPQGGEGAGPQGGH